MISTPAEPRGWSARRWWTAIALVFTLQAAAIFLLEDRSPPMPRKSDAPAFRFAGQGMGELLTLQDQTIFATPHRQGFSGLVWLTLPSIPFHSKDWSEPARFLPPEVQEWGTCFRNFVLTSAPPSPPSVAVLKQELPVVQNLPIAPPPAASRLRMEGDLATRRLLQPPRLPSWTNDDLLTNSIVQLLVDSRGNPVSAVLLRQPGVVGSLKQEAADGKALALAKAARFEPFKTASSPDGRNPTAGLSMGTMVFEWQTILAPATYPATGAP